MPPQTALTAIRCQNAKAAAKAYKLSAGEGMYLEVMPNGSKYWRLKYRYNGKEKRLALGVFPLISLADAREKRIDARRKLAGRVDPSQERQDAKRLVRQKAANTFEVIAREWHEHQK